MSDEQHLDLRDRAEALEAATSLARGRLDDSVVDAAVAVAGRVRARLRHGTDRTVVALAGPTGSGKSTLFNALIGAEISQPGVLRPTTAVAHAALWGGDEPRLLRWLEIPRRHLVPDGDAALDGLILVDLPDIDSVAVANRQEAERLIEVVDCMVWVVDPQKYADEVVHDDHVAPLAQHAEVLRFALTKVDLLPAAEVPAVVADFERRLRDDGIPEPVVWPIALLDERVTPGPTRSEGVVAVREGLAQVVAERRALTARLDADLGSAADGLVTDDATVDVALDDIRRTAIDGAAAAAHVDALGDAVALQHRRQARRTTGWLPLEWVRRRRPSPVTDLVRADGIDRVRIEAALRDAAESGTGGIGAPWDRIVRQDLLARSDDLSDALRSRAIGVARTVGAPPRWWRAAAWLQRLLAAATAVGLVWLFALALIGATYLDTAPFTPRLGAVPIPTVLFFGGIVAGILVGLLARVPARIGSRRRAGRTRKQLRDQVAEVVDTEVVDPLQAVLDDRAELARLATRAAGRS